MDSIHTLPLNNKEKISEKDKRIVDTYFITSDSKTNKLSRIIQHFKPICIATFVFVLFMIPYTDKLINLCLPYIKNNAVMQFIIKTILFFMIYYILYHRM